MQWAILLAQSVNDVTIKQTVGCRVEKMAQVISHDLGRKSAFISHLIPTIRPVPP